MKRTLCAVFILLLTQLGMAYGADTPTYFGVKGGIFLPNGKGLSADKTSSGLGALNTGYSLDVAIGFKPATYAAIELGSGFFSASGDTNDTTSSVSQTAYGVPVTLTAKGVLNLDKIDLYAGAGAGYYFCFLNNKVNFANNIPPSVDESAHGSALGYLATAGFDYKINNQFSAGVDFKWFSARPEIEYTDSTGTKIKPKVEFGGTILNLGMKYNF